MLNAKISTQHQMVNTLHWGDKLKFCAITVTKANIIRNTSTPMQEHYLLNLITVFYLAIRRVERVQPFILNSFPVWPE